LYEQETGKKPDFVIELHSTPEKSDMTEPVVWLPEPLKESFKNNFPEPKRVLGAETKFKDSIGIEVPAEHRKSNEFEDPIGLPGVKVSPSHVFELLKSKHPKLDLEKNQIILIDVPYLMKTIYPENLVDMDYRVKAIEIHSKEAVPEYKKVKRGEEFLINTLKVLTKLKQPYSKD
jgi:hypothetical protein